MTLDPKIAPAEYNYRNKAETEAATGNPVKREGEEFHLLGVRARLRGAQGFSEADERVGRFTRRGTFLSTSSYWFTMLPLRLARLCCLCGLLGGILMLSGDMLFYGAWVSGADFHSRQEMAKKSVEQLVLGGSLGPVAGILYAAGMGIFYIELAAGGKRLAGFAAGLLAITMLIGGAYHAVFTNFGFAAKVQDVAVREVLTIQVRSLYNALSVLTYFTGIPGTLLVYWTALRTRTPFPRWLLFFIPTVLTLIEPLLQPWLLLVPAPLGGLLRGGWTNGCFVIFFAIATIVFWRPPRASPAAKAVESVKPGLLGRAIIEKRARHVPLPNEISR